MGDLTLNYNAEATYYGAGSSNHLNVFAPYVQTVLDYVQPALALAQFQFRQCKNAIYFPGHILPYGVTTADNGDMGQRQMALFAAVPLILYWQYSRDLVFASLVMHFFVGVANFWQCVLTEKDGLLHDLVDCAQELCSGDGSNQPDPPVVLSFLPKFFETVAELATVLGVHSGRVPQWRSLARRIAPYPQKVVDGRRVIVDFAGGDGAWSGQFATFPLGTIGLSSSALDLSLAAASIDRFFQVWPGGKQGNSFVHIFAAAARAGWRPDRLFSLWEAYLSNSSDPNCAMYPNGLVLGCGGTGLENVGGTAFVNELLLQSHEGVLRLFPAVPSRGRWAFRLRAVGGFTVTAVFEADRGVSGLRVASPAASTSAGAAVAVPRSCALVSPWGGAVRVNGAVHAAVEGVVRFAVEPATEYAVEPVSDAAAWI